VVLKVVVMIFLWDIENVPTAVYICNILIGAVCATALSILVRIVNFSVTTTCVYMNSTYKWSISMVMIVEI